MIHIACLDKLDADGLGNQIDYAGRSFGLGVEQIHDSPPVGLPVVLVQPTDGEHVQGDTSLVDFTHPDECVYLFGASNGHVPPGEYAAKVYIPHQKSWTMFAPQAVAVVLYDRYVKRGTFG